MLRSIVSVAIGFLLWTLLWLAGNAVLKSLFSGSIQEDGATSSAGLLLLLIVLSVISSMFAGYVTARIATGRRMTRVFWLGIVLLVVGLLVELGYWTVMPVWYHIVFLVLIVPSVLFGNLIHMNRSAGARRA